MDDLSTHYNGGFEQGRLFMDGEPRLELVRTLDLLHRFLPPAPAKILDVGGGPGVYAARLAQQGHVVHLIDPVQLHVEQALEHGTFSASVGDARTLDEGTESADAVLLLGPLYHLTAAEDRHQTLREAFRVLRTGGIVVGAAISRHRSFLGGLVDADLDDPTFHRIVLGDLATGHHVNPEPAEHPEWFVNSFWHTPAALVAEVEEAGFDNVASYGIEGPGWMFERARWRDERLRSQLIEAARLVEEDSLLMAASAHLLAVGTKS